MHWCGILVNIDSRTVTLYDSLSTYFPRLTDYYEQFILPNLPDECKGMIPILSHVPSQNDSGNCGCYILHKFEMDMRGLDLTPSFQDMSVLRARIAFKAIC